VKYPCFPNSNRSQTKVPTNKSLEFNFKKDQYGKNFICLNDAGAETCYQAREGIREKTESVFGF
jgi:hypothetical protein